MLKETVQKAKEIQGFTSDLALGQEIGVSDVTIMRWRKETSTPKPEHAQRLAELAEIDPAPLLLDCLKKATQDHALQETIMRIKKAWRLSNAALITATAAIAALLEKAADCILCKITKIGQNNQKSEPSGCPQTA